MKHVCLGLSMLLLAGAAAGQDDKFQLLFDGHSLSGWEGNKSLWRVDGGAIIGGTLEDAVVADEFLCTQRRFGDFELRLEARMSGAETNGGVSFRGHRLPNSTEVGGYQADMGFLPGQLVPIVSDLTGVDPHELYPLWGSLLDEYRPEKARYPDPANPYRLIAIADRALVDRILRPLGWNRVTVTAIGNRIEIGLNGVKTIEYVEQGDVPRDGHICLQIHSGPPSEARYRNIRIQADAA